MFGLFAAVADCTPTDRGSEREQDDEPAERHAAWMLKFSYARLGSKRNFASVLPAGTRVG